MQREVPVNPEDLDAVDVAVKAAIAACSTDDDDACAARVLLTIASLVRRYARAAGTGTTRTLVAVGMVLDRIEGASTKELN